MMPTADPAVAKALAELVTAMGLPPDADPKSINDALTAYLTDVSKNDAQLSASQRKIVREAGITSAEFLALKNRASR